MGHTAVSAIKASSVTFRTWQKEAEESTVIWQILTGPSAVSKTDMCRNRTQIV